MGEDSEALKGKVLISGGSGLVGRHLGRMLRDMGYGVALLSRKEKKEEAIPTYIWNPVPGIHPGEAIEKGALDGVESIIHLAGISIGGKRWSEKRKKEILDSRVKTAEFLFHVIREHGITLKTFITASASGYYGTVTTDRIFWEDDPPGGDFTGSVCRQWEEAADRFSEAGMRTVKIRTGVVLSGKGGALPRLSSLPKLGLGAPLGSGKQYMPWIHLEDLSRIYAFALENEGLSGPYNAVAPEHLTNREFTRRLSRQLGRPCFLPSIPAPAMRLLFGEMAVLLLEGSRISPEKILSEGFRFTYPDLATALDHLYPETS
jgi:uncharacterized protein (TIGR01777 family)